jgi:ABC-type protease/lipase transport system fused ATPase/permease subunit
MDHVLVMANGRAQAFGPKDEVLARTFRRAGPRPSAAPLKVVAEVEEVES